VLGGVEAGGTKFVCAIGTGPQDLRAQAQIETTTPEETIARTIGFFTATGFDPIEALGVASFGPIDRDPASATWGRITSTPKAGWAQADLAAALGKALGVPVGFDTDVNGAALAEHRWGSARGLSTFIYVTVGTGIGGGAMVEGRLLHGLMHPEMGHVRVTRRPGDHLSSVCPFHSWCLEGLASGPAIEARWGARAETLPLDHPAWRLEADYLAQGLANLVCTLSPERIVLGGGVMKQVQLFPLVRRELRRMLNGYIESDLIEGESEAFVGPPGLGGRAGALGAIALAERVLGGSQNPAHRV